MTSPAISRDKLHTEKAFDARMLPWPSCPQGWPELAKEEMQV
ncbi:MULTISPECIES: hypothetical protein [unclassified Roseovarius]|nr:MULTISPECIES: hypothetical protein [unclassified Roseovarius]